MAEATQEATPTEGDSTDGQEIGLKRFRIQFEQRLSGLASAGTVAFGASAADGGTNNFALVCDPHLTPRVSALPILRKLEHANLLTPVEWGTVSIAGDQRRKFAIVFDKPTGGRVLSSLAVPFDPITEEIAIRNFLTPITDLLGELQRIGVPHGAINPVNFFYRDNSRSVVMLGECVTTPPGARQPVLFAPVEVALAAPLARGRGSSPDDIYALGVTLIVLLLGQNPLALLSDREVIAAKIEKGTYVALQSERRLPTGMSELLRGLVSDDPRTRWTLGDIEDWLLTRGPLMRPAAQAQRPTRPFEFRGEQLTMERKLAFAFAAAPAEAAASIRSRKFDLWLQNTLGAEQNQLNLMEMARNRDAEGEGGEHRDDLLVARICIALDPLAPIRYRGLSVALDGFGSLLAATHKSKDSPEVLNEMMKQGLPQFWLMASPLTTDGARLAKAFRNWQNADERVLGQERILYEMNPDLHCLSPLVESDYVLDVADLLPALEQRATSGFGGSLPVDRHITAFTASRSSFAGEWISLLQSPTPADRVLGALQILARIQRGVPQLSLPRLSQWFADQAKASVNRYHNRKTRNRLAGEIPKTAKTGNLSELLAIVDNFQEESRDASGFALAMQHHNAITAELQRIINGAEERLMEATAAGDRAASVIASVLAWLAGLASLMLLN